MASLLALLGSWCSAGRATLAAASVLHPSTTAALNRCPPIPQATEPASLVPLVKGAECVIMAGDQKQLPPTVLSKKALE